MGINKINLHLELTKKELETLIEDLSEWDSLNSPKASSIHPAWYMLNDGAPLHVFVIFAAKSRICTENKFYFKVMTENLGFISRKLRREITTCLIKYNFDTPSYFKSRKHYDFGETSLEVLHRVLEFSRQKA